MTFRLPPYVEEATVRKGARTYFYYWYRRGGRRIKRLPHITEPTFADAYKEVHERYGLVEEVMRDFAPGTLGHLIATYKASPEFASLEEKTKAEYRYYLDNIKQEDKLKRVAGLPREWCYDERDRYSQTPSSANHCAKVISLLLAFAIDRHSAVYRLTSNPAYRLRKLKTGSYRPWEEYELEQYRERWALGTLERTALELFLNTGQRVSDVVKMAKPHFRDGAVSVAQQEKTGERVWVPLSNDLKEALAVWWEKQQQIVVLTGKRGGSMTTGFLSHTMTAAIRAAKLPEDCVTHGLRYTAATRLHELGCDWPTVADITGHRTAEMARKYTEKQRRAKIAIKKLNEATAKGNAKA